MSLDPMPSARELRAMAAARGVAVPPNGPATPSKPTTPSGKPYAPFRSKWEADYADYLDTCQRARLISAWEYEPKRLEIGAGAYYTPDFRITRLDGAYEWREVKGFRREASIVRLKVAAQRYPNTPFILVTKIKGEWIHTLVKVKR